MKYKTSGLREETRSEHVHEGLKDQVNHLEQEARMVLPGIQALFGFQFIAVLNQSFKTSLSLHHQYLHWLALALTAVSTMLMLTPAAYHRQVEPDCISASFVKMANCFVTLSMIPLMVAVSLDFYVVGTVISANAKLSLVFSSALLIGFVACWFVFPQIRSWKLRK